MSKIQYDIVLILLSMCLGIGSAFRSNSAFGDTPPPQPNIVVIMTDDQTLENLRVMQKTLTLIADNGVKFSNFFASYPYCSPSRATLLTGQYSHNHGVITNYPPYGGYSALDNWNTLPIWLQNAGYYTIHIGKYLNGYGNVEPWIPPGWNDWQGLVDPFTYQMYNYKINDNGTLLTYGSNSTDYQTDVLADRAVAAIGKQAGKSQPFFLSIALIAPHAESALSHNVSNDDDGPPPRPAPRHVGTFANEPLPKAPSFNEVDVSDKPKHVSVLPRLTKWNVAAITKSYRARLEALLAVDDLTERVINALDTSGALNNTIVFFLSDNGYLEGQHRFLEGKFEVYEESTRLPLLVRGRGFPAGVTANQYVADVDLAPTIVALTGATANRVMDGTSLLPLALDPTQGQQRALLLESGPISDSLAHPEYQAVRTERYVYVEYVTNESELYDFQVDEFQLTSKHSDPQYDQVKIYLKAFLNKLRTCSGSGCLLYGKGQ
ncbi:MAG: sulfatase [Candidatus Competibacter sp.]|nr:sulfatase [Candidatus Competibacter sp.]